MALHIHFGLIFIVLGVISCFSEGEGCMMGAIVWTVLLLSGPDAAVPANRLPEIEADNPYRLDQSKSCGLRCCLFLDQYFSGTRTFDEVLALTPVSSRGTNMEDLAAVLRSFDYQVTPKRASAPSLKALANPALLAVRQAGGDHFVVAIKYDITIDSFLVYDPPRKLGWRTFKSLESQYRNYALIVSNGRNNQPGIWTSGAALARNSLIASGIIGLLFVLSRTWRELAKMSRTSAWLSVTFAAAVPVAGCDRGATPSPRQPQTMSLEKTERNRDVGRIIYGTPLEVEFRVPNTSDIPFDVIDLKKSCACQTVTVSKSKSVLPNEQLVVAVEMNANTQTGHFIRDVTITTTSADPSLREICLSIQGDVVTLIQAIPSQVSFGEVDYGSTHRKTVRVEAFAPGIAKTFTSVSSTEKALSPRVKIINEELIEVSIEAAFKQCVAGDLFGRIDLHFVHPKVKLLSVDVNARVRSRIRVVPRVIIVNGNADNWPKSLRVESTDGTEFGLFSVAAPSGIVTEFTSGHAQSFMIELSRDKNIPQLVSGAHSLSIATDFSGGESVQVPVVIQRTP